MSSKSVELVRNPPSRLPTDRYVANFHHGHYAATLVFTVTSCMSMHDCIVCMVSISDRHNVNDTYSCSKANWLVGSNDSEGRERVISNGGGKSTGSRGQWYTWCADTVLLDVLQSGHRGSARSGSEQVSHIATIWTAIPLSTVPIVGLYNPITTLLGIPPSTTVPGMG